MAESNLKDFVEYIDDILIASNKDINAFTTAAQIFLEFQKKNDIITSDFVSLGDSILKEMQEDGLPAFCVGLHLGMILGKYSKHIEIQNVKL